MTGKEWLPVIVADFHLGNLPVIPDKADTVLAVDADTVLMSPIARSLSSRLLLGTSNSSSSKTALKVCSFSRAIECSRSGQARRAAPLSTPLKTSSVPRLANPVITPAYYHCRRAGSNPKRLPPTAPPIPSKMPQNLKT